MIEDNLHREYYNDRWKRQGTYLHPHAELRLSRINLFCEHWLQATGTQHQAGQPCVILDLGCGTGWLSKHLRRFGSVVGVEPSSEGIQRAISTYGSQDAGIEFLVGTGETLLEQGRQAAFDLVVSSEVIEHAVDQLAFLRQINKLLRQRGYAILSTPRAEVKSAWIAAGAEQQPVENWLSKTQLLCLVEEAGFDVVRCQSPCPEGRGL